MCIKLWITLFCWFLSLFMNKYSVFTTDVNLKLYTFPQFVHNFMHSKLGRYTQLDLLRKPFCFQGIWRFKTEDIHISTEPTTNTTIINLIYIISSQASFPIYCYLRSRFFLFFNYLRTDFLSSICIEREYKFKSLQILSTRFGFGK